MHPKAKKEGIDRLRGTAQVPTSHWCNLKELKKKTSKEVDTQRQSDEGHTIEETTV